jgi:chaperonin GroES
MTSKQLFQPLHDRILVQRTKEAETTAGGLFVPPTLREKSGEGIVIAVGGGKVLEDGTTRPMEIKVGDQILFLKYAGVEIKLNEEEYLILNEADVLGKFSS